MSLIVSIIVGGVKIALWINVCADDWTAKRSIFASNVTPSCTYIHEKHIFHHPVGVLENRVYQNIKVAE